MGNSGGGKSTFVDAFANFIGGVELCDQHRYKLTNEKLQDTGNTQSGKDIEVVIYHIPKKHVSKERVGQNDFCINIIDTPGFGRTGGMEEDKKVSAVLEALITECDTPPQTRSFALDKILLVHNSSDNRATLPIKAMFAKLTELYGTDVKSRILGMFSRGSLFEFKAP